MNGRSESSASKELWHKWEQSREWMENHKECTRSVKKYVQQQVKLLGNHTAITLLCHLLPGRFSSWVFIVFVCTQRELLAQVQGSSNLVIAGEASVAAADASTATTALGRSFSASMFDHDTGTLPQMVSNNEALMNIGHAMIESKLTVSEKLQGYMQQMLLLSNEQSRIQLDAASLWDSSQVLLTASLNVLSVNARCQLQSMLDASFTQC